ncbi:spore cortex protein [Cytobacillus eiseniae]|uniref:Spore cortex protein n=1 Tax=Cytobacillus eiseniae TaxID=762947 RepID=A0ABS4RCE5_9BACI|nr:YhcN/YlaJ family sporulation lipoprotein [Cytobacillus eiseniae]MBP2240562.1 spore cortex protein [Cytobacillus eiseniae]
MNKKLAVLPFAAFLTLGLAGCGANDESASRNINQTQPLGYYSNENHQNRGGNAQLLDGADNDGPVTEIMDHSLGAEGKNKYVRVRNDGTQEPHLFSREDKNYHGHLGNNVRPARNSYYEAYSGELVEKINMAANSVTNVKDSQTVVNGEHVIIAARINDANRTAQTKARIREAVYPYLKGKNVKIVTDESTYNRLRNIDNDLRDGGPKDQLYLDVKNMIHQMTD